MKIYIPTYKRTERQRTLERVCKKWKERTYLVGVSDEYSVLKKFHDNVLICPVKGIAATRQWIVENADDDKILMMDDDMDFDTRISKDDWHLRMLEVEEFDGLASAIEKGLDDYVQVGISPRYNNHTITTDYIEITRQYNMYGFRRKYLIDNGIRFDEMKLMEDFHVTLSILERGEKNLLICNYVWNQPASNIEGGCSEYRTSQLQQEQAYLLKSKHEQFVKVVEKQNKNWKNFDIRTDVIVYWKKAYQYGLEQKELAKRQYKLF